MVGKDWAWNEEELAQIYFVFPLASICNIVTLRTLSLQLEGPGPVIVFRGMFKGCKMINEEFFVIILNLADLSVTWAKEAGAATSRVMVRSESENPVREKHTHNFLAC